MARRRTVSQTISNWGADEPWPVVDEDALTDEKRSKFKARRQAIDAYLAGELTLDQIARSTGVSASSIGRLARRCIETHPDGRIWGYRALLDYQRVREYHREAPIVIDPTAESNKAGLAGAFEFLLDQHPELRQYLENEFLKRGRGRHALHEKKITTDTLHKKFLEECRRLGIRDDQYPFTQKEEGLRSLYEFIKELKQTHMVAAVRARGRKQDAQLLEDVGIGSSPIRPDRPFRTVEFDGHRVDMHMTVEIPTPFGPQFRLIERIWLLAIIDIFNDAVLGYYLSLNFEYNRYDVLRCVLYSLIPPPIAPQVIDGLLLPKNGRVANDNFPELYWTAWDEVKLDNAMAHRAHVVRNVITKVVGASILQSRSKRPTKRPYIENFFKQLEEHVYHRIPGTTGSNPKDPRGEGGQEFAQEHAITLDMIWQLADHAVAGFNNSPRSTLYAHSPMEATRNYLEMHPDSLLRKLPPDSQLPAAIISERITVVVQGNILQGRRPYVNFLYVRYTNDVLACSPDLINKKLTLSVNPDDPRSVFAYLPDGRELGYLTARGQWGRIPHTLEIRSEIFKLIKQKKLLIPEDTDPVEAFMSYMEKQSPKLRRSATQWTQAAKASPESIPEHARKKREAKKVDQDLDIPRVLVRAKKTLQ